MPEQKLMAKIGADISDFNRKMKEMSAQAGSTGTKMAVAFKKIGRMLPLAITGGIGASIKAFIDFEAELANVSTLVDTNKVSMQGFKRELLALPSILGDTTEITKGLYQALSAGVKPAEAVRFVGEAAKFAKAGITSTFTAVDVLTTVINAYGKEAEEAGRISDIMFKTIELGKTTAEELASQLGEVIPFAVALKIRFEEVTAAIGAMTIAGIRTDIATTALRAMFSSFIQQAPKFRKAGIEVQEVLSERGLGGMLEELSKLSKGNIEIIQEYIPEVRAMMAALSLGGVQLEKYNEILKANEQSLGATTIALEKQTSVLKEQFKAAWVDVKKALILTGEFLAPLGTALIIVIGWLSKLGKTIAEVGIAMANIIEAEAVMGEGVSVVVDDAVEAGNKINEIMTKAGKGIVALSEEEQKERARILEQFKEAHIQTTQSTYEYEIYKLNEAYKEFAKYVIDKTKLNEWYLAAKKKIDDQELEQERARYQKYTEEEQEQIQEAIEAEKDLIKIVHEGNLARLTDTGVAIDRINREYEEHFRKLRALIQQGLITWEKYEKRKKQLSANKAAEIGKIHADEAKKAAEKQADAVDDMIDKWFDWIGQSIDGSKTFLENITDTFKKMGHAFVIELVKMFAKWVLLGQQISGSPIVASIMTVLGLGGGAGAFATATNIAGGLGAKGALGSSMMSSLSGLGALKSLLGGGGILAKLVGYGGRGLASITGMALDLTFVTQLAELLGYGGVGAFGGGLLAKLLGLSTTGGSIGGGAGAIAGMLLGGPIGALIGGVGGSLLGGGLGKLFGKKKAKRPAPRHRAYASYQAIGEMTDPIEILETLLSGLGYSRQDRYARQALQTGKVIGDVEQLEGLIKEWIKDGKISFEEAKKYKEMLDQITEKYKEHGKAAGKLEGYGLQATEAMELVWEKLLAYLQEAGEMITEEQGIEALRGYKEQLQEIRKTIQVIRNVKWEKIREIRYLLEDLIGGEPSIETMIERWTTTANTLMKLLGETEDAEGQIAILDQLVEVAKEAHAAISEEIEGIQEKIKAMYQEMADAYFEIDDIIRGIRSARGGTAGEAKGIRAQLEGLVSQYGGMEEAKQPYIREKILALLSEYIASMGASIKEGSIKQVSEIGAVQDTIASLEEQYTKLVEEAGGYEKENAKDVKRQLDEQYTKLEELRQTYEKWIDEQIASSSKDIDGMITSVNETIGLSSSEQLEVAKEVANMINDSLGEAIKSLAEILDASEENIARLEKQLVELSKDETRAGKTNAEFIAEEIKRQKEATKSMETAYTTIANATLARLGEVKTAVEGIVAGMENIIKTELNPRLDYLKDVKKEIETRFGKLEEWYTKAYDLLIKAQVDKMEEVKDKVQDVVDRLLLLGPLSQDVNALLTDIGDLETAISALARAATGPVPVNVYVTVTGGGSAGGTTGEARYESMLASLGSQLQSYKRAWEGASGMPGAQRIVEENIVQAIYSAILGRGVESAGAMAGWISYGKTYGVEALLAAIMSSAEALAYRRTAYGFQHGGITTGARPVLATLSETPGSREAVIPLNPQSIRMIANELGLSGRREINVNVIVNNDMLDASTAEKMDWDKLVRRKIFPPIRDNLIRTVEPLGRRLEVF